MKKILTSLAAVLVIAPAVHAKTTETASTKVPKLVVGITIEQLRGDYLQLFENSFSERGFKRLLREGLVYQNIQFDFPNINSASAIATIYTGAMPTIHGIMSDRKYSIEEERVDLTFADSQYLGYSTEENLSPKALKATTISDELKIASKGRSTVYSFAPNSTQALITAGNAGNCAYWVEDYSGKWASTTFYKDFNWIVDQENRSLESKSVQAWGAMWSPLLRIENYQETPYSTVGPFGQKLGSDKDTYLLYKQTPLVNESVAYIAQKTIEKSQLGQRRSPDFLSLTFYAGRYQDTDDYSLELQDTYVRLDRSLGELFDFIESTVGMQNTLIFVASTGHYIPSTIESGDYDIEITSGKFYPERCQALLNMYLMAIYGSNNQWVDKYYDGQIYLNRKLIKEKGLSLKGIQDKSAEFVAEFSGVQDVYTLSQIRSEKWNPRLEKYRNGLYRATAGDILVELQPGYQVTTEQQPHKQKQTTSANVTCPLFFLGANITPKKIGRTVKATEIAPSVTHILRIRPPNAAEEGILPELQ